MVDVEVYGKMLSHPAAGRRPSLPVRPVAAAERRVRRGRPRVEGDLPDDLYGVYLRNTENPLHPAIVRYHPFDGDGMIHKVSFRDGKVSYRNRFVRTDGLLAEQEAGRSLWAGARREPERGGPPGRLGRPRPDEGRRVDRRDRARRGRGGQLLAVRRPVPARPADPGRPGQVPPGAGRSPATSASPPTPRSTTTPASCCSSITERPRPTCTTESSTPGNRLVHYVPIELPGPRLPHDMAYTEHYAILNDMPLFWEPEPARQRGLYAARFHPEHPVPARRHPAPRRAPATSAGSSSTRPTCCTGRTPTSRRRDHRRGFFQGCPEPASAGPSGPKERMFRFLAQDIMQTRLHRWRMNLVTGATQRGGPVRQLSPSSARSTAGSAAGRTGTITPPLTSRAGSCSTGWSSTTR